MSVVKLENNLLRLRERIEKAAARAGREADSIRLVAITKSVGVQEIKALYDRGLRHFGENRPAAAVEKIQALPDDIVWHMVGSIQRRKARDVCQWFNRVDALDRLVLADALEARLAEQDKAMPVLIEVNVSGEEQKHGFRPAEVPAAIEHVRDLKHLRLEGLMTMAPYVSNPEDTKPVFASLAALAREFKLSTLSMGMSNDFEVAIEEGATELRVGSALFAGMLP